MAPNPEVNHTGAYGTATIEVDIGSLALNTILESGRINDVEVRYHSAHIGEAMDKQLRKIQH